jgi:hypothetical protein
MCPRRWLRNDQVRDGSVEVRKVNRHGRRKRSFLKKRTKKLLLVQVGVEAAFVLINKSFLLLFSKKEVLAPKRPCA